MPNIRQELLIAAPAGKLYDALTTREGLSGWWTADTRFQGTNNDIIRFGFGPVYFKEMKITILKPSEKISWTCLTGAEEWMGTTITFTLYGAKKESLLLTHAEIGGQIEQLSQNDEGTILLFQHDNWKDYTPMFAECSYTWAQFMRSIKLWCETGRGRPFPNQHR